jgi:NDP-sugar pyrophosphorylase family protein
MSLPVAILAGGLATRLGSVTRQIPKSLIEVAGKPFAQHQLELLHLHGMADVVFCVGHLGELVENALGDGSRWGMCLRYSYDGPALLGTGGALQRALPLLGKSFFVLYGDSYLECDYRRIEQAFLDSEKLGLMTVHRNLDMWDRSNVLFRNGIILRYDKGNRTPEMQHIDYGLGVLRAEVFNRYPADTFLDLEGIYRDLVDEGELSGYEVAQRFYEIGSPAGLEEIRAYLSHRTSSSL